MVASVGALALGACMAEDPEAPEEPVAAQASALSLVQGYWHQSMNHPVALVPASDAFCYLTGLGGKFIGEGEHVSVTIHDDGWWYLDGSSGQQDVHGMAACARWGDFAATPERNYSLLYTAAAWDDSAAGPLWPHEHQAAAVPMWDRNSFCMLTGFKGALNGPGEHVYINPGAPDFVLDVDNWVGSWIYTGTTGYANCAYLGQVGEVAYVGGDPSSLGQYYWNQGDYQVTMARTDEAICFLTGITGRFMGIGEEVEIAEDRGFWVLRGKSGQNSVGARARCVAANQRIPARLFDPGFEQQQQRGLAWPWGGEGPADKGFDRNLGFAATGQNNAYIYTTTPTGWSAITQDVPVKPHTRYTLSLSERAFRMNNSAALGVRGADGHLIGQSTFTSAFPCMGLVCCANCANNYQRRSVSFDSGNDTQVRLFVGYSGQNGESWLQIDDVQLAPG
jgi:hypothetical protein